MERVQVFCVLIIILVFNFIYCYPPTERNEERNTNKSCQENMTHGTDQGLYNAELFEGDIVLPPTDMSMLRNAIADKRMLWPYGAVVYSIDPSVGCPDSWRCKMLGESMDLIHDEGCVRFKQWSGEKYRIHIFVNSNTGDCWSPVGRSGNQVQLLSLGSNCWYHGIVLHELLHAIGFWHEMTRPDRDSFVNIYWQNIMPGFKYAFSIQTYNEVDTLGEYFDYSSLMMYDEYAFSKDGVSATLRATAPGVVIGPIWKKSKLSRSDTRRLHRLYSCQGNNPLSGFPYDVNCDFNADSCGFKNSGTPSWHWRRISEIEGYLYTTKNNLKQAKGYVHSATLHPVSANRSKLGCVKFYYYLDSDSTSSYLKLMHAYLKRSTEVNFNPDTTYELWSSDQISGSWIHVQIPIYVTRPFKLLFESWFDADSSRGTVAIDNLEVLYSACDNNPHSVAQRRESFASLRTDFNKTISDFPLL